jgi:hypothetical protein
MFKWLKKKEPVKEICGNCKLYNYRKKNCGIAVLYAGKEVHIPVDPSDECFYQNQFVPSNEKDEIHQEPLTEHVEQVRWWMEDPVTGEPGEKGNVKIEYPDGFFGPESEENLDLR